MHAGVYTCGGRMVGIQALCKRRGCNNCYENMRMIRIWGGLKAHARARVSKTDVGLSDVIE